MVKCELDDFEAKPTFAEAIWESPVDPEHQVMGDVSVLLATSSGVESTIALHCSQLVAGGAVNSLEAEGGSLVAVQTTANH
jgi:hypothetical protein